jgi:metal-responsive CopG/Arc/MetJ family transcriptional regulator
MTTISLNLDDELNSALEEISTGQGCDKSSLVIHLLRQYVEREQLKRALQEPALARLYEQLQAEDLRLAEQGMAEYHQLLDEADRQ